MNKLFSLLLFIMFSISAFAQIDIKGGMGINLISMPGLRDYLNANYAQGQQLSSFSTAISFDGEVTYQIQNMQYGLDFALETNSFSYDLTANKYKLSYTAAQPSATAYYVLSGEGYLFKCGGGLGPRFLSVTESGLYLNSGTTYTATGWGFLGRVDAGTAIAQSAFAYIGGEIGYNHFPIPESAGSKMTAKSNPDGVNFSEFFVSLKLGVIYSFNL